MNIKSKTILIIFMAIGISSCLLLKGTNKNPILGKWFFYSKGIFGEKMKDVRVRCGERESLEFFKDGMVERTTFKVFSDCKKRIEKKKYTLKDGKLIIYNKNKEEVADYLIGGDTLLIKADIKIFGYRR